MIYCKNGFRKFLSLMLCIALCLSGSVFSFAEGIHTLDDVKKLGDVDMDGSLTAADASVVLNAVLGKFQLTDEQTELSQVTGKKVPSVDDASAILQKVLNNSFEFIPYNGEDDSSTTEMTTEKGNGTETSTEAETNTKTETSTESETSTETEANTKTETSTEAETNTKTETSTEAETSTEEESSVETTTEASNEQKLISSLNASDLEEVTAIPENEEKVCGEFTIKGGGSVAIDANNKTFEYDDGSKESFSKRIKLGGKGDITKRAVAFNVNGDVTVKVLAMSSASSTPRSVSLSDGADSNKQVSEKLGGDKLYMAEFKYKAENETTLYIYSEDGGVNIYKIEVYSNAAGGDDKPTEGTTEISTEVTTSDDIPSENSKFNLTGFGYDKITGGGAVDESNAEAYVKVSTPKELDTALYNARNGKIKVIEITADLNLGWNEIDGDTINGDKDTSNDFKRIEKNKMQAKNNDILIESGVSTVNVQNINGLTIFSKNGAKIKHACFVVKACDNLIIRNIEFDEIWEWDEGETGNSEMQPGAYDRNDWDYITFTQSSGVPVTNAWVDHCTFHKAYDGMVDIKEASHNIVISWCKFLGDDMTENSWVTKQINQLEKTYTETPETAKTKYPLYCYLRETKGYSKEQIIRVQAPQKKAHLVGHDDDNSADSKLAVTIYNCYYKEIQDRIPRLRFGNAHIFNTVIDSTETYKTKNLKLDLSKNEEPYHFGITNQALISTCGGALLAENIYMKDVNSPMSFEQKAEEEGKNYAGKLYAEGIKYYLHKGGSDTEYKVKLDNVNSTGDEQTGGSADFKPTEKGSTMKEFSWNESESDYITNGELTYNYNLIDTNNLESEVVPSVGAGVMKWNSEWLETEY